MAVAKDESFPRTTRIVHNSMAIAVTVQLLTSLFMRPPHDGQAGNFGFAIHQFSGMIAFVFVLIFWVLIFTNRVEKPIWAFFPYLTKDGRASLKQDIALYWEYGKSFKLPPYDGDSTLPSAVEGLGLLLVTYMGATGMFFGLSLNVLGASEARLHGIAEFHEALHIFLWLYVIGHGGMGVVHQYAQGVKLSRMWSFRK